jgi:hypothetical protein
MTRKHFKQIAEAIKALPRQEDKKRLADYWLPILSQANPRFDSARFLSACGL